MRRRLAVAAALGALAAPPATALADETLYAVPGNKYSSDVITIDQGEALIFRNLDFDRHDVTARAQAGGKPLFASPLIGTGGEAIVQGTQQLPGGSYQFYCTVHTFMTGTLNVTGSGAPAPPPSPSDTRAPGLVLKITDSKLSKVRKDKRLRVSVKVDEPGNVQLTATMKSGKKTVTIARTTKAFTKAGSNTVAMALTKSGQSALKNRSSAAVTVAGHATDGAGNTGHASTKRTLKN